MKAVSLKEPYATLIWMGIKKAESRTWKTTHRGPLLICASKTVDWGALERLRDIVTISDCLPGYARCAINVTGCRPMTMEDEEEVCCPLYPRANVWIFDGVEKFKPFAVKGALSLFKVPFDLQELRNV